MSLSRPDAPGQFRSAAANRSGNKRRFISDPLQSLVFERAVAGAYFS
jgi:hypothetical protein